MSWFVACAVPESLHPNVAVAGAKVDAQPSVKTPFINEYGSGWFFSLAAGSAGLYASDHSLNCIRKLEADTGRLARSDSSHHGTTAWRLFGDSSLLLQESGSNGLAYARWTLQVIEMA